LTEGWGSIMRIGVLLPTRNVVTAGRDPTDTLRDLVALAAWLEGIGCDSLWVGDSLLGRPRPEPLTVLAALATVTRRITLGTSALLPAMRHPLHLAQQLASVDLLARGRLVVGVGVGFPNAQTRRELDALGIDYRTRAERCHEAIAWCRAAWGAAGPDVGRYWHLDGVRVKPGPVAGPGRSAPLPPFWLGGSAAGACRAVGRDYDGWMPTSPSPDAFAEGWRLVREAAEAAGRDPAGIVPASVLTIAVDDDGAAARNRLRRFIEIYYSARLEQVEQVVGCVAGNLDEVASVIERFAAVGVSHLQLRFADADQATAIRHCIEPLMATVRPL
jgi:alkanesulfonate monooxygenase SsuD/methylene tetrahydromethanopterin reductase-like flavin-dependent oxidoreductase (luciferase family)